MINGGIPQYIPSLLTHIYYQNENTNYLDDLLYYQLSLLPVSYRHDTGNFF